MNLILYVTCEKWRVAAENGYKTIYFREKYSTWRGRSRSGSSAVYWKYTEKGGGK